MKSLILWAVLALSLSFTRAQSTTDPTSVRNPLTVHKVEFTLDTLEEMEEVDWDDIFGVFEGNSPTDSIEVGVVLKEYSITDGNGVTLTVPRLRVAVKGEAQHRVALQDRLVRSIDRTVSRIRKFRE